MEISGRLKMRCMAGLLTLIAHAVIFAPLMLGAGAGRGRVAHTVAEISSLPEARADQSVTVMLLLRGSVTAQSRNTESGNLQSITTVADAETQTDFSKLAGVPVLEVSGWAEGLATAVPTSMVTMTETDHSQQLARYLGQVTSRIQREWKLPGKGPVAEFHCRVQIRQNADGVVQEVTLQRCDSDTSAQLALVNAVQRASPLPVLPAEGAMADTLTLDFAAVTLPAGAAMTRVSPSAGDL